MGIFTRKFAFFITLAMVFAAPFALAAPIFAAYQPLTHAPAVNSPTTSSGTSFNWSGYESTNGTFTGIGATWTIPTVAASSSLSADATWIGIGGVSTHDLIQVGTQAVTGNGADQVQYQAWFETLPQTTQQILLTVNAGDSVTASITQTGSGEWEVSFRDNTTGGQYSTEIAYASSLSSTEWIEEAPSDQDGILPLDQFGAVSFTGAYAIENGTEVNILNSGATPLSMSNTADQLIAVPSALNSDGASFTVSRTSAAATVAGVLGGLYVRGRGRRVGVGIQGFSPSSRGGNTGNGSSSSSTGFPFNRFQNFNRGQFRIQIGFGTLGQRQLLQFFREEFNRGL